jgi:hypothetical protein
MQRHKWLPDRMLCESPKGAYQYSPVAKAEVLPPGHNRQPIRNDCYCLVVTMVNGGKRYFGFDKPPIIDSYLKMRIKQYNPLFEEVNNWPDADVE